MFRPAICRIESASPPELSLQLQQVVNDIDVCLAPRTRTAPVRSHSRRSMRSHRPIRSPAVHDPDWRRVERRPVETFALDEIGRSRAHLAFQHLPVFVVKSRPGLEAQQVAHPHTKLGAIRTGLVRKSSAPASSPSSVALRSSSARDQDDGNALVRGPLIAAVTPLPIHAGHHDVEQDEIGGAARRCRALPRRPGGLEADSLPA